MDAREALRQIWLESGCRAAALDGVRLGGSESVLPSSFRVATAALIAAEIWRLRGGPRQRVSVDTRHAAVEFRSEHYFRVDDRPPPDLWDKIAGVYRAGDGRWMRHHTNFPHHREGLLALLGCAYERGAVSRALEAWEGEILETAAAEAGLVVAMMRTSEEWQVHPQGRALAQLPLMSIEQIGEAPPRPLQSLQVPDPRPLGGVRVLDLTRIVAGPVCGRTLAAHGADVLRVTGPHLPAVAPLVIDMGRGKRSTYIDLRKSAGRQSLRDLLEGADVFVQGYRPGAVARLGFAPDRAAAVRPGLVYVSLSAYSRQGPWAGRRGFDSLVQTATGINHAEAVAAGQEEPKALPCQALDHASGYLMAFGAMVGLMRRSEVGGSWHVRVSLAQTGRWLQQLGRRAAGLTCADPTIDDVADLLEEAPSGFGRLRAVRHAGRLSETPPRWSQPSMPLGSHPPAWLAPTD